jgi:Ser/Thr protein kinase RdoA (MazF antagonist)
LRAYHETTVVDIVSSAELIEHVVRTAKGKLASIMTADSSMLSPISHRTIQHYLDNTVATCHRWEAVAACQIHGDFDVSNILLDGAGDLVIVDFADSRRGFALEDAIRVWHGVDMMASASWRRRRPLAECAKAILEGYGLSPEALKSPLARVLRCWNAVTSLLMVLRLRPHFSWTMARVFNLLAAANRRWLEANVFDAQTN